MHFLCTLNLNFQTAECLLNIACSDTHDLEFFNDYQELYNFSEVISNFVYVSEVLICMTKSTSQIWGWAMTMWPDRRWWCRHPAPPPEEDETDTRTLCATTPRNEMNTLCNKLLVYYFFFHLKRSVTFFIVTKYMHTCVYIYSAMSKYTFIQTGKLSLPRKPKNNFSSIRNFKNVTMTIIQSTKHIFGMFRW